MTRTRLTVTVDTNAVAEPPSARMQAACRETGVEAEFAHTTVTDRETEGTSIVTPCAKVVESAVRDESPWVQSRWVGSIPEVLVIGESCLGRAVLGGDHTQSQMDAILRVLGSGSFRRGESLSPGERRQLRDAMILEAHWREGRDVFVTNDGDFINHGRGEALETLCGTRIMTVDEFCDYVSGP